MRCLTIYYVLYLFGTQIKLLYLLCRLLNDECDLVYYWMLHFNLRMEMQPLFKMSEKERKRKCFLSVPIYASNLQPAVYLRQLLFLFKYQEKIFFARILAKIQKCGKVAVLRQYPLLWSLISFEGWPDCLKNYCCYM